MHGIHHRVGGDGRRQDGVRLGGDGGQPLVPEASPDDHLGTGRFRETGRVIEHAERHLELLLALDMPHERGERCVHREHDVLGAKSLAERGRRVVVEPEAARESDLAGPIATGRKEHRRLLERGRIRES